MAKNKSDVEVVSELPKITPNKSKYISFEFRLVTYILLFIASYAGLMYMATHIFTETNEEIINVKENGKADYKVYLKPNDFYDSEYLEGDMTYVSSLIKSINVDYNYSLVSDKNINCNFIYDIVANLVITDGNGNKFFTKEYVLAKETSDQITNSKNYILNKNIAIDYDYYNTIASKFKTSYGLNAASKLIVSLRVKKESDIGKDGILNNSNISLVTIPLSEKSINLKIDTKNNSYSEVVEPANVILNNMLYIIYTLVLLVLSLFFLIKVIRLIRVMLNKKSEYDLYIENLLKEYDRLIVETTSMPDLDDLNVFKISKFTELLDVRDNLKLPIMYYIVSKHNKCHFYIKNNNDIFIHTVKDVDLVKKNAKH